MAKRGMGQKSISKPGIEWPDDAEVVPAEVDLPVCPKCGMVGKNPGGSGMTYACVGPMGEQHRRTRMVRVRFRPIMASGD